jgi:uncharacterized protein YprB with RNaseH-like and TPR domain
MARAGLLERLMRLDNAAADYQKLYDLQYKDPKWMEKIAELRARQGKPDAAVQALKLALVEGRPQQPGNYFAVAQRLEGWGMLPQAREFADQAVFFDIETDGTSEQVPTVVSLFHREGFEVFIRGRNLEKLPPSLGRWPLWITFNGTGFDVPVLEHHFPDFPKPALHLDLRHICQRLGLRGGLKKLEGMLGFGRPPRLTGVDGFDAILLWRAFRAGEPRALRMLVEYNLYDSIQLRTLMETVYNRGVALSGTGAPRLEVFRRGDVLLDISKYLLQLAPDDGDDGAMLSALRRQLPPS